MKLFVTGVLTMGIVTFSFVSPGAQCPPGQAAVRTVVSGVDDNFALPVEGTGPAPGMRWFLTVYFGNALRDFDETGADKSLAHTLHWDATEFCSAFLTLHIQAINGGGAESNDTISMEYNPDFVPDQISAWAWGLYIGDIVGQLWQAGEERTLVLDLMNLPPDPHARTSVAWALEDGSLDVCVDDDTVVDYMKLTLCGCTENTNAVEHSTWGKVKALYR